MKIGRAEHSGCGLQLMQVGDTIEYAKVTDGLSNLERPAVAQAPKDGGAPAPSLS